MIWSFFLRPYNIPSQSETVQEPKYCVKETLKQELDHDAS